LNKKNCRFLPSGKFFCAFLFSAGTAAGCGGSSRCCLCHLFLQKPGSDQLRDIPRVFFCHIDGIFLEFHAPPFLHGHGNLNAFLRFKKRTFPHGLLLAGNFFFPEPAPPFHFPGNDTVGDKGHCQQQQAAGKNQYGKLNLPLPEIRGILGGKLGRPVIADIGYRNRIAAARAVANGILDKARRLRQIFCRNGHIFPLNFTVFGNYGIPPGINFAPPGSVNIDGNSNPVDPGTPFFRNGPLVYFRVYRAGLLRNFTVEVLHIPECGRGLAFHAGRTFRGKSGAAPGSAGA
jgi:hypothetical protein